MPNILLTRIDNRLVHGQVGVTWTTSLGANLIVVADDLLVNDPLQQQLMKMTADSAGVQIRFFTIDHTIEIIHKASASQKIFLVCKTPAEAKRLIEGGVPIPEVNVGNMHFTPGKRPLSKKVYVDDEDLENLKFIKSKGIDIYIQDVPGEVKEYIK